MSSDPTTDRAAQLRYLELTAADRVQLAHLAESLLPHLDAVLADWHGFLLSHPATAPLLTDPHRRGHLRDSQRTYFRSLLTAPFDAAYFDQRARVGRSHHQVGLTPFWYLGAYRKFLALVRERLGALGWEAAAVAAGSATLEKVVTLDLALALEAYQAEEQGALFRSHQELEQQLQRGREAARLKEEFLARISHELRTPLHAMLGFADLVADGIQGPVTADQRDSLAKVRRAGERLGGMMDQLIEAAKLSAAAAPAPQPFDPVPLLDAAAAFAADAAALKGLQFIRRKPVQLPWVLGDPRSTAVAVRQLLDNAVRFTAQGEVELRVSPTARRLRLAVRDTGPGVPAGETERIFEPFHQVDGGDQRRVGGAGLGLALAREALQRSGGTLVLEQTGADGSTFVVELPLAPGPVP